ncbi:MAG: hypothetical protein WC059_02395 [Candidatus Paceibacterota bacterium]
MREYIKKLQSKPEPVRKQIVVGLMAVSMLFVGVVFVYSMRSTINGNEKSQTKAESLAPFRLLGDSISETYNNMSASVGKVAIPTDAPAEDVPSVSETPEVLSETVPDMNTPVVTEEAVYE